MIWLNFCCEIDITNPEIMRKITLMLVFSLALYSCEKDNLVPEDNYGLDTTAKIKTKYIFASSTDSVPYNYVSYFYDEHWNLIKELISNYPEPAFASYTYKYSDKGVLLNKKYYAMEGLNFPDQTESDGNLIVESYYEGFYGQFLSDKTTYKDGNIIEYIKYHPTMPGEWYCYRYEYY